MKPWAPLYIILPTLVEMTHWSSFYFYKWHSKASRGICVYMRYICQQHVCGLCCWEVERGNAESLEGGKFWNITTSMKTTTGLAIVYKAFH